MPRPESMVETPNEMDILREDGDEIITESQYIHVHIRKSQELKLPYFAGFIL